MHETVEDETIVIDLDTGSYYSLTGSGAVIWQLLGKGTSVAEISAELARHHARPEGEVSDAVTSFVTDLQREGLVEESDGSASPVPAELPGANGQWELPKLERYDDMRDFLLVDPIHDVDQTGWPNRKPPQ